MESARAVKGAYCHGFNVSLSLFGEGGGGGGGGSLSDVPQLKLAGYQSQPCNTMYSISKQYKEK